MAEFEFHISNKVTMMVNPNYINTPEEMKTKVLRGNSRTENPCQLLDLPAGFRVKMYEVFDAEIRVKTMLQNRNFADLNNFLLIIIKYIDHITKQSVVLYGFIPTKNRVTAVLRTPLGVPIIMISNGSYTPLGDDVINLYSYYPFALMVKNYRNFSNFEIPAEDLLTILTCGMCSTLGNLNYAIMTDMSYSLPSPMYKKLIEGLQDPDNNFRTKSEYTWIITCSHTR